MVMDVKRLKLDDEEDRISDLPDSIVHHIMTLLPSTREAICTGILSKRWKNQWTRVPVLIFNSRVDQSEKNFLRLIDNALHLYQSSKIKRLVLSYNFKNDPDFSSKIRFATNKNVEQLILICHGTGNVSFVLPKFLISNSSLVELRLSYCCFNLDWNINWPSLKTLEIAGWRSPSRPLIGKLVSGCPMLESLMLTYSDESGMNGDDDVIVSKSLKKLILVGVRIYYHLKISCPNLVVLMIKRDPYAGYRDEMVEISCPNLKSVGLSGTSDFKLVNCPSLVDAFLDFEIDTSKEDGENVAKQILVQLKNVKELIVGRPFMKILSALEMKGLSYPMLNNKILKLFVTDFDQLPGVVCALRSSPVLERLRLRIYRSQMPASRWDSNDSGEIHWNSNVTDFKCLKCVEIIGLSEHDAKSKHVIDLIEFVLKNARVLEKLIVVISKEGGLEFGFKVCQKVLSFSRCSPHATVELSQSQ